MSTNKGRKKRNANEKGSAGNDNNRQESLLVAGMPIATAILANDMEALSRTVASFLPNPKAVTIENLVISKSQGEAFTGGRSTPVYHVSCDVLRGRGNRRQRHFVVKLVLMPNNNTHSNDDDATEIPHSLWIKRESYAVERRFYDSAAPQIRQHGQLAIPRLLGADNDDRHKGAWPAVCFIMNDVRQSGYASHPDFLSPPQAMAALKWLAAFHALFWGQAADTNDQEWRRDVWDRGGFWTPKQRKQDNNKQQQKSTSSVRVTGLAQQWNKTVKWLEGKHPDAISSSTKSLGARLEHVAGPIADFLMQQSQRNCGSTLLHGDYKAANMFFRDNAEEEEDQLGMEDVAVLDFQFAGMGVCAEDVAYLLFPDARGDYFDMEKELLECYHEELISQLMIQQKGGPSSLSLESFQAYYELARIDFLRYLLVEKGWIGSNEGDKRLVKALEGTLDRIDGAISSTNNNHEDDILQALSSLVS
ncbi:Protein of unknown function (DUF1679) [Seminavis robusta]|uniref:CHK kinase-like domain-containing protein n=1 Tax=Seminavis robusta TaxID=568900 RepID=A0A9N8DMY1_9STRA|nr:Protein of unknown function (DUF1679) [Seminavis robusta]|eukprot:Sro172_g076100.1 Protein of unknown function (DUF1679) (475) ;mRNA; r:90759-92183